MARMYRRLTQHGTCLALKSPFMARKEVWRSIGKVDSIAGLPAERHLPLLTVFHFDGKPMPVEREVLNTGELISAPSTVCLPLQSLRPEWLTFGQYFSNSKCGLLSRSWQREQTSALA